MSEQPAIDWRTLPAGLDLDRVIAERLGWSEIGIREVWVDDGEGATEVKRLNGRSPGPVAFGTDPIPTWSTNTDTALNLPLEEEYEGRLEWGYGGEWTAWIFIKIAYRTFRETKVGYAKADIPALALCRAWLGYQERVNP